MGKYYKATLSKRSGKQNYYVFVTVPKNLRPVIKARQLYKSTGTEDFEEARDKLRELEAELYLKLDHAELSNHPLCKAYDALWEALGEANNQNRFDYVKLFNNDFRWDLYDEIRNLAGYILGHPESGDLEDDISIGQAKQKVEPLAWDFDEEFRKVSEEKYAPTKRSKPFKDVAEEWFSSSLFKTNKKTNEPKREKTKQEQINKVSTFIGWAGNISLDDFNNSLATKFMEELTRPESKLIAGGAANETVQKYFTAVRAVLDWGVRNDYLAVNPWAKVDFGGYGRAKQPYRDFSEVELRQTFSLDMPKQDRLLLSILASTGARLDEIALLSWGQVHEGKTKEGDIVHWLDTTEAVVKNRASRRLIPIVPEVWDMLEAHKVYRNKKEPDRLFSYPKDKDGKAENKASRAIMPHLRKISTDPTFAIHSLRHTFTTLCRDAGVDWELREFVTGPGGRGEGSNYGQPAHVKRQLDAINQVDYSFLRGNLSIPSDALQVHPK